MLFIVVSVLLIFFAYYIDFRKCYLALKIPGPVWYMQNIF